MKKVLVIGGGFGGCCPAHLLEDKGFEVTLIEKAPFLGGGCKTFWHGGHPFTYGPRHFLTQDESLFNYINEIIPMRRIDTEHYNLSYVERDQQFYVYPPHMDDVARMPEAAEIREQLKGRRDVSKAENFEEYVVGSVGRIIYEKFFEQYSKKMWKIDSNKELDGFSWGLRDTYASGIKLKEGLKAGWEGWYSAFPYAANGYDDYFPIATKKAKVHLNTEIEAFDLEHYKVKIAGDWHKYDIIISTLAPDIVMNNIYGPLRWMGREFHKLVLPIKEVFPPHMYFLYFCSDEMFTRVVEYKKFYQYESPSTLLVLEVPSTKNKLYPFPVLAEQERAKKYVDAMPPNVYSVGRMGTYRYLDVDDIIAQCKEMVAKILS